MRNFRKGEKYLLTIKMFCDIEILKRESRLPNSLVQFLVKTFSDLHEAYESETDFDHFSLEMHGPIYLLQASHGKTTSLKQIGFHVEERGLLGCIPEWVEKIDLEDCKIWRLGFMPDNGYLFQVILPVNVVGPDVESWLEELALEQETYSSQ